MVAILKPCLSHCQNGINTLAHTPALVQITYRLWNQHDTLGLIYNQHWQFNHPYCHGAIVIHLHGTIFWFARFLLGGFQFYYYFWTARQNQFLATQMARPDSLPRFATRLYFEYFTRVIFLEAHEKSVGNSTNRQIMIHCTFTLQSMHFTIQLIIIHHEISFIQSYKYFCTISNSITQSNNNFPLAMPILDGCFGYQNL